MTDDERRPSRSIRRRRWLGIVALLLVAVTAFGWAHRPAVAQETGTDAPATADEPQDDLGVGDAIVLGVVEGLTEYLPVSSTGHLLVTNRILDIGQDDDTRDAADSYVVVIQAGAILAVLVLYRKRVQRVLEGVIGRDPGGRRIFVALVLSFLPAGIAALALRT